MVHVNKKHHSLKSPKKPSTAYVRMVATLEPPDKARPLFDTLYDAVNKGDVQATEAVLKKCPMTVGYVSPDGEGPIHAALAHGSTELLTVLLEAGANPNQRNAEKKTALYIAVEHGNIDAARVLLEYGAEPSLHWEGPDGTPSTPLLLACLEGDTDMVRVLLQSGRLGYHDVNHMVRSTSKSDVAKDTVVSLTASSNVIIQYQFKSIQERRLNESFQAIQTIEREDPEDEEEEEEEEEEESDFDSIRCDSHPLIIRRRTGEIPLDLDNGSIRDKERLITEWKTIYELTTHEEIRELLKFHGATTADGFITDWVALHATASMSTFCKDLQLSARAKPNHPILLIPGLCSSILECWKSIPRPDWIGTRHWLSIQKMGLPATLRGMRSRSTALSNQWLEHLMLAEDGYSDREGISLRPATGLHAVDYLCGSVAKDSSYVLAHLIRSLKAFGYTPQTLDAFPYDWRLPPSKLEDRDGALTELQAKIEIMVKLNGGARVLLMGHSMGNKLIHYFLFWIEQKLGREWIDAHVRCFIAVGPPWIGAAKSLRSLLTGDAMGLDVFLTYDETIAMSRNFGSAGWLTPLDEPAWKENGLESFIFEYDKEKKEHIPAGWDSMLNHCEKHKRMHKRLYSDDPLYEGVLPGSFIPTALRPPPVQELICVYGKNLPTEVGYLYRPLGQVSFNKYGEPVTLKLDRSKRRAKQVLKGRKGFTSKNGIFYETPWTTEDGAKVCSGDGTVPFASLTYHKKWENMPGAPNISSIEIDGAEHREMLCSPLVIGSLIRRIGQLAD